MAQPMTATLNEFIASLPLNDGFSMPARFGEHERTLIAWPPKEEAVNTELEPFRDEVIAMVKAISAYEPVTVVVDPADEADARAH